MCNKRLDVGALRACVLDMAKPNRNEHMGHLTVHTYGTRIPSLDEYMQLSKFMALARSCPVSIGWVPKQSDISRTALWTSFSSSSQGRNLCMHQAGFTFKLNPDESSSLSQIAQKCRSALVEPGRKRCSAPTNRSSSAVSAPLKISLQVDHINFLIFSPSQPSVLCAQTTLLGLEAQLTSCQEHHRVTASADGLLVTDKRALVASYHALVSMLPDAGRKCLQVSFSTLSEPQPTAHGATRTSFKHQSAQLSSALLTVLKCAKSVLCE